VVVFSVPAAWFLTRTPAVFVTGRIGACSPRLAHVHPLGCAELRAHPRLFFIRIDGSGTPDGSFVVNGSRSRAFAARLPHGRYGVTVLVNGILRTPRRPSGSLDLHGDLIRLGTIAPLDSWEFGGTQAPE
jgi:hypothetical protein